VRPILCVVAAAIAGGPPSVSARVYLTSAVEASRLQDGSTWRDETIAIGVPMDGGFGWSAAASHRVRNAQEDFTGEVAAEVPLSQDLSVSGRITAALYGRIAPRWQIEGGAMVRFSPDFSGVATLRRSTTSGGTQYAARAGVRWFNDWAAAGVDALASSGPDGGTHWGVAATCEAQIAPGARVSFSYSDAVEDDVGRYQRIRTIHARIAREFESFTVSTGLTFEERDGPDRMAASVGVTFHGEF
jgi:hypothetical protein